MDRISEAGNIMSKVANDTPQMFNSFMQFNDTVKQSNVIDMKHKELILVALALYSQCEWCIGVHIAGAIEAGATKQEILESCMLCVVMGGGPKLMHMGLVYEELDKYFK